MIYTSHNPIGKIQREPRHQDHSKKVLTFGQQLPVPDNMSPEMEVVRLLEMVDRNDHWDLPIEEY
jgi:hypothetical protein